MTISWEFNAVRTGPLDVVGVSDLIGQLPHVNSTAGGL